MMKDVWTSADRTVCVDFDGVLHPYTRGWVGAEPDDEPPTPGAREALARLRARYSVVVYSARCHAPGGRDGITRWLRRWRLLDLVDGVTGKKVAAVAYIDDRAVPFAGDWDEALAAVGRLRKVT